MASKTANKAKRIVFWVLLVVIFLSTTMLSLKLFAPQLFCEHEYENGVCIECEHECNHNYVDGVCEDCDMPEPAEDVTE